MVDQSALAAALAVARRHGIRATEPRVLRDFSNLLVHLAPAPVVARVATVTAQVRADVAANLARDLAIATYLTATGVPAVPPSAELPSGPHIHHGHVITFWRYVEHDPDHAYSPAAFATHLADLHRALRDYPGDDLPTLPPTDVPGALAVLAGSDLLTDADRTALRAEFDRVNAAIANSDRPTQPLHGDAHPGNLLHTPNGPLWNDFEDAWRGPIEWDLACVARSGRIDGITALAAYPGAPTVADLGSCYAGRRLAGASWHLVLAHHFPDQRESARQRLTEWRNVTLEELCK